MLGTILGHYRLLSELGRGGTATVYLAEDIHLQRQVAVKVFQPELQAANRAEFLAHFTREARVLARLDHPHILPVYEYGEQDICAYLVMPYMPGGSLKEYLQKHQGQLPLEQTLAFIHQVLNALEYAHQQGLIHRDIKPGNILFKNEKTLMLSDFGLVKIVEHTTNKPLAQDVTHTNSFTIKGTPDYMAPEQIQSKPDKTSDIYALGVVLYELLTGQRPFYADDAVALMVKHLYEPPRPLHVLNSAISPELEAVVLKSLEKDPTQRFQSVAAFREALEEAIHTGTPIRTYTNTPTALGNGRTPPVNPFQTQLAAPMLPNAGSAAFQHVPAPAASMNSSRPPSSEIRQIQEQATAIQAQSQPSTRQSASASTLPTPPPAQKANRLPLFTYLFIGIALATSIFAILYSTGYIGNRQSNTPQPQIVAQASPTSETGGKPAPAAITTDCPAGNVARTASIQSITPGNHRQVVYIVNEGPDNAPTRGTLKRRDIDDNTRGTPIIGIPNLHIDEGELMQGGQWITYILHSDGISQLRLVRIDGQEQQTLYCAPANTHIANMQLSYNGQNVVFNQYPNDGGKPSLYLLSLASGSLQLLLQPQNNLAYTPTTWLDNTHILLTSFIPNSGAPRNDLYALDIIQGSNQHDTDLQKLFSQNWSCGSFDVSYDTTKLYVASCDASNGLSATGPTTISVQPSMGGTPQPIAHLNQAVTMLRAVSPTMLLLMVENGSGDTSQNGLWRMNTDGTGLTRLTDDTTGGQSLCPYSQYAWSNVTQDSKLFALQETDPHSADRKLYYGSLDMGTLTPFADIADGTDMRLVGWTLY
ncbi:hypothetical protein KSD_37700 [Ktedonobacter sp. SOSP1-85]|uniref:serine/threonine protein kinase n=1 Tax=Ktedonobacter sp. SOSP1-85 TaxID=2778367 RepID=UPI001916AA8C|nr:serine/threonine-protein kinase [Ktedonobacter sp. SOSP1-85]GHO75999.1 hypothetical protein KSD_37700 [Ktedonobacter sp. SOSP1-85]